MQEVEAHGCTGADTLPAVAGGSHRDLLAVVVEVVEAVREHHSVSRELNVPYSGHFSNEDTRHAPGHIPLLAKRRE